MNEIDDGGPAFPDRDRIDPAPSLGEGWNLVTPQKGMSLRDWFAGMALSGLLAHQKGSRQEMHESESEADARVAYARADAMIKARKE